jgi:hypothetical protein
MAYERDRHEKTEYMKEENIKEDIWTSGTKETWRIKSNQELQNLYKGSDIIAHTKKKDWNG